MALESPKNSRRLLTLLLVAIIVIMMVQNYLLVRKNDRLLTRIERLTEELSRRDVLQQGDSIQSFTAMTLDSLFVVIDQSEKRGKLFLVFTTWCAACLQNMAQWNRLSKDLSSSNILILGISPDLPHKIKQYSNDILLVFGIYSIANDSSLLSKYRWKSYPQTILLDENAKVLEVFSGVLDDQTRKSIENRFKK